jgi:hypothetical protein
VTTVPTINLNSGVAIPQLGFGVDRSDVFVTSKLDTSFRRLHEHSEITPAANQIEVHPARMRTQKGRRLGSPSNGGIDGQPTGGYDHHGGWTPLSRGFPRTYRRCSPDYPPPGPLDDLSARRKADRRCHP